jgi:hypothetical protein
MPYQTKNVTSTPITHIWKVRFVLYIYMITNATYSRFVYVCVR